MKHSNWTAIGRDSAERRCHSADGRQRTKKSNSQNPWESNTLNYRECYILNHVENTYANQKLKTKITHTKLREAARETLPALHLF